MNNWLKELVDEANKIIYSQWAALGANIVAPECRRAIVDPEALLVATCAFGRYDARIFDEAMDWTGLSQGRLKPWRLRRICEEFGRETTSCLAAMFEYLNVGAGKSRFDGLVEWAGRELVSTEAEVLFFRERHAWESGKRTPEPTFAKWGFLRGAPRIRQHSVDPDLDKTANLMLRLRRHFGSDARGDVLTYLVSGGSGSSRAIAAKVKCDQGAAYRALERLLDGGIVFKKAGKRDADYWVDHQFVKNSLGLRGATPVFFVWSDYFRALHMVAEDIRNNTEGWSTPFFSAESSRKLTVEVAPMIRNSGEPLKQIRLPDISKMRGAEHNQELRRFLDTAIKIAGSYVF